jgi:putative ABC transport system permease protein
MLRVAAQDLRFGLRMSLKNPGFTLVAVLTLAVGIAASTTVFSWIDSVLVRPIPGVTNGHGLLSFESRTPNGEFMGSSYPDYRDHRDHLKLLAGLAVTKPDPLSIGEEDHAERVWGELVSGNYFAVLGVKPAAGRFFSPEEFGDKQGGYPVAVISYSLWKRRFSADPGVIGSRIRVNRQKLTIIGVAPPEFRGTLPGLAFETWIPLMMAPQLNTMPDWMLRDRHTRNLLGLARPKPGVTIQQANAEVAALAGQLASAHADTSAGVGAALLPVWKAHSGAQSMLLAPLQILMAVCGVVLLIVCANVANLLLARITARHKEFSVRLALGAGRGRLVMQLLAESLILAIMGGLVGAPLALWMAQALGALVPPAGFPIALDIEMNADIFAFTMLLCMVACVLSGIAPALHTARADLSDALKQGGRSGSAGKHSKQLRGLLVVSEVALALVAIIGAGLFARSFQLARQIHPGFDASHILVSNISLSTAGYSVPDRRQFCFRLRERLEAQPGIAGVTYADFIPLGFDNGAWEELNIEGYEKGRSENMQIYRNVVAPGYFKVLGVPLLQGRDFTEQDDTSNTSEPVMIVNQAFARRYFGGGYPIGRRVHGWGKWFSVVGVVKDSKYHTPNEAPQPYFYVPFKQVYRADMAVAVYVRTAGEPNQALGTLRREVRSMDPNVSVYDAMPLTEYMAASLFVQKIAAWLLGVLGAVSLVLAAVGLYSVVAYSITQRTHEIGIRVALGAQSSDVVGLVVRQGMGLTLVGLLVGVLAAAAVTRLATGLLVNVSATDPLIFAAGALFLAAIALAASCIPALRATRIDPNTALRCQ